MLGIAVRKVPSAVHSRGGLPEPGIALWLRWPSHDAEMKWFKPMQIMPPCHTPAVCRTFAGSAA